MSMKTLSGSLVSLMNRHTALPTRLLLLVALVYILLAPGASAQPVLNFKRVVNNWPTIELYFTASCLGQPVYFTDSRVFSVRENGKEIGTFNLWCPDATLDCALSVVLVFDASSSMAGAGNSGAKAGGLAFVDYMNDFSDEAAVIWFNSTVTWAQPMTVYKDLLQNAINSLPASGTRALYDGIYESVLTLINDGINGCRAVIVLTDGADNSSTQSPAGIIALAQRNRIRISTVGFGSNVDPAILRGIADNTGGRYYQTSDPSQLASIYRDLFVIILSAHQECLITYEAVCKDGTQRAVDLTLHNFCNGIDTKSKSFRAPLDGTAGAAYPLLLPSLTLRNGHLLRLPLLAPGHVERLVGDIAFTLEYDTTLFDVADVLLPGKSPFAGLSLSWSHFSGGITGLLAGTTPIGYSDTAVQFNLRLKTAPDTDTLVSPLTFRITSFSGPHCLLPDSVSSSVTVLPTTSNATPVRPPKHSSLHVFPDPATTSITIQRADHTMRDLQVRIYDALGRLAVEAVFPAGSQSVRLAISDLPPGFYTVHSEADGAHIFTHFIVR